MKIKLLITNKYSSIRQQMMLFLMLMMTMNVWGQTTIVSEGLNNSSTLFTVANGAYYTGNSATGDRVASSPFAAEGTHGYGVSNASATLTTTNNINTSSYTSVSASFRLAAFSISSTGNGVDATDIATVEISPNGGTTWYSTVRVKGSSTGNNYWSYSGGTGTASTAYDGDATPVDFAPAAGGLATTDGYSTVTVTGLPAVTTLRIRITLLNNSASERWVVDDFKVTGTSAATVAPVVTTGTGFTGTAFTAITNFQIQATNSPTSYAISTGTLPTGLTLNTTTGIISGTPSVAGTGSVSVTASNSAGTSTPVAVTYNIAKANQTITFGAFGTVAYGDANITLNQNASSGLPITYVSSNPTVASISGNTVTILSVGNTNITASQAGNTNYNAATDVVRVLTVNARAVTITGLTGVNKVYDASTAATATGTPALNNVLAADAANVTLSGTPSFNFATATVGNSKTIATTGYTLTGSKASNYVLTQPSLTANITRKPITVTGAVAQNKVYDGTTIATISSGTLIGVEPADAANVNLSPTGVFATATPGTGIAVTVSLTGSAIGNYQLTQPGLTADILKAEQTINFEDIPVQVFPTASINLNDYASSSEGLALTYSSSNPSVATVSGSVLTIVGAGTVTITASQAGNANYNAAANVTKVVTIITKPVATAATNITNTTFTANWQAVPGATSYQLDVYKKEIGAGELTTAAIWNFNTANPSTAPTQGVTVSAITQGNNNGTTTLLTSSSASDYTGASGNNNAGAAAITGVFNSATSAYFEFTVTPTNGNFTLDNISFGARSTTTGPRAYTLRSSLDGYVMDLATGTISNNSTWSLKSNAGVNFTETQPVTFRLYGYNGTGTGAANTANWRIDDLTLSLKVPNATTVPVYVLENEDVGNATSYTISNLELNTEYFYVARAVNGSVVTPNSNEIAVTTKNGITWNGTSWSNGTGPTATDDAEITGEYSLNQGFEVNNLAIVGNGLLTIQNNQDVVVNGNIILSSNDKIVMESDANLVQTSPGVDTNPTNFSILAKRNALLPTAGYTFWSSPLSGQNVYSFSNGYNSANGGTGTGTPWNRFYVYRESTDTFVTSVAGEITLNAQSVFETGRGYAIKGQNSFTNTFPYPTTGFSFTGKINNGQVFSQPLRNSCTVEEGCEKGYNLVGNPYPSSIDFEALYAANSSKIYGTAYFWTNNDITVTQQAGSGYSGNNYAIYNLSGGTSAVDPDPSQGNGFEVPNGIIKLGQGFIVKSKVAAIGQSIEFNNNIRLGYDADAIFYNSKTTADKNRFWLTLTSPANVANTILLAYIPQATNGFEVNYDGELFVIGSDSFYSLLGSRKLAIQGKAAFNADDKVALGNVYSINGQYKISIKTKEGIFNGNQNVYLKDNVANKVVNLTEGDYTFQAIKGTDASRFEIVYKEDAVLGTDSTKKSDFEVYRDGTEYVITSSKTLGKIEVYDATGKLVISQKTANKSIRLDASAFINGIYIIKAENSGDLRTKKIIK